jgi:vacuolar-type H+-ATPase subunit I/STV1
MAEVNQRIKCNEYALNYYYKNKARIDQQHLDRYYATNKKITDHERELRETYGKLYKWQKFSAEDVAAMISMTNKKAYISDIATRFNITPYAVRQVIEHWMERFDANEISEMIVNN